MNREEKITARLITGSERQGWYWDTGCHMVAFWIREELSQPAEYRLLKNGMEDIVHDLEKSCQYVRGGIKPSSMRSYIKSYHNRPALYAIALLIAKPEDMDGVKEGRP